jgi:hypothetical protein
VVQSVGHLTVNEDGEGSNPSAPANFFLKLKVSVASAVPIRSRNLFVNANLGVSNQSEISITEGAHDYARKVEVHF